MDLPTIEQLAKAFCNLELELKETRRKSKELKKLLKESKRQTNDLVKERETPSNKPVRICRSKGVRDSEGGLV